MRITIYIKIEPLPIAPGGPPQNITTPQEVNSSILDYCANHNDSSNSVCGSLALYTVVANYLKQNNNTPEQIALATTIFQQTVPNISNSTYNLDSQTVDDIVAIGYYIFVPIILISIVVIWYAYVVGWIPWSTAIFSFILVFIVCYICFISFRIICTRLEQALGTNFYNTITTQQQDTLNNIAYWPKGLLAVMYALQASQENGVIPQPTTPT